MSEIELKPCPFCGGKPRTLNPFQQSNGLISIRCDCGANVAGGKLQDQRVIEKIEALRPIVSDDEPYEVKYEADIANITINQVIKILKQAGE